MNPIGTMLHSMIPSLKADESPDELTEEEILAQEKKDRIEFHRHHLRTGPQTWKEPTNGQHRRARARTTRAMMKRSRRSQIRSYFEAQCEASVILGHLQTVGVVPYVTGIQAPPASVYSSAEWLLERFADIDSAEKTAEGQVVVTPELVQAAFQSALNRWQTIVGAPVTALPDNYVVPA